MTITEAIAIAGIHYVQDHNNTFTFEVPVHYEQWCCFVFCFVFYIAPFSEMADEEWSVTTVFCEVEWYGVQLWIELAALIDILR